VLCLGSLVFTVDHTFKKQRSPLQHSHTHNFSSICLSSPLLLPAMWLKALHTAASTAYGFWLICQFFLESLLVTTGTPSPKRLVGVGPIIGQMIFLLPSQQFQHTGG